MGITPNGCSLKEYLTEKAINYALIAGQAGFDKIAGANKAIANKAIIEAEKQGIKQLANEGVKKEAIKQLAKVTAVKLAETVAVQAVVEYTTKKATENLLENLEERLTHSAYKAADSALRRNEILLQAACSIERGEILKELNAAVQRATKEHKNAAIINKLASGIFSAAGSHYAVGKALHAAHKVMSITDAIAKIEPMLDSIKEVIEGLIGTYGQKAQIRLNGSAMVMSNASMEAATREEMCHAIGKMVSTSLINVLQRKVVAPLVSTGAGMLTDRVIGEYKREQHQILEHYSHASKQQVLLERQERTQERPQMISMTGVASGDVAEDGQYKLRKSKKLPQDLEEEKFDQKDPAKQVRALTAKEQARIEKAQVKTAAEKSMAKICELEGKMRAVQHGQIKAGGNIIKQALVKGDGIIETVEEFVTDKMRALEAKYPNAALGIKAGQTINARLKQEEENNVLSKMVNHGIEKVEELNKEYIINPLLKTIDINPGEKGYRTGAFLAEAAELGGIGRAVGATGKFIGSTAGDLAISGKATKKLEHKIADLPEVPPYKSAGELAINDKLHKNSHQYVGETHVYKIIDQNWEIYKIGESAQGVNEYGQSKRAIQQAKKLYKQTGQKYKTDIIETFSTKKAAYEREHELIKAFREEHGKDSLPGNKGNH